MDGYTWIVEEPIISAGARVGWRVVQGSHETREQAYAAAPRGCRVVRTRIVARDPSVPGAPFR